MPNLPDTPDTIKSLIEQANYIDDYLRGLKAKPMPTPVPPRPPAPPEPTLAQQAARRFMENAAILNKSRQAAAQAAAAQNQGLPVPTAQPPNVPPNSPSPTPPPARPPNVPANQPGSFTPYKWISDYLKNRPTPGTFQPGQWVRRPPAPTAPQPGTSLIPAPQTMPAPNASATLPRTMPIGPTTVGGGPGGPGGPGPWRGFGLPSAGLANLLAPAASMATQRDYPRYTPQQLAAGLAAWRARNQPQQVAQPSVPARPPGAVAAPFQKDQSRMPLTPAWTGMIPSPAMAQAQAAPQAWSAGTPLPRPRPQVPLPRPRPQIPIARPGVGGKGAAQISSMPPSVLDQILKTLLGSPKVYVPQAVNEANR